MLRFLLCAFVAAAQAFTAAPNAFAAASGVRASLAMKGGPPIPKGPFGDFYLPGEEAKGWVGDTSQGTQIAKFEAGEDYLFFQGPAPETAIQEDLPSLFSIENLSEAKITVAQIGVTATGIGSAVALATLLTQ